MSLYLPHRRWHALYPMLHAMSDMRWTIPTDPGAPEQMRELIASYTRKDFRVDTFCTGGPGGQNQNRKRKGARITHLRSGLASECRVHKSFEQNRKIAFQKLGELMRAWHQKQIQVEHVRSQEVIRSYHEPDNRVIDNATGIQIGYGDAMHKGIDRLITARRKAWTV